MVWVGSAAHVVDLRRVPCAVLGFFGLFAGPEVAGNLTCSI